MNPKQLTILAVLTAVAGGIFFAVNSKREKQINKEETKKIGDRALADFAVAKVDALTVKGMGSGVELKREGAEWMVSNRENYGADDRKVRALLFALKDMKILDSSPMRGAAAQRELQLIAPADAGEGGSGAGTLVKFSGGGADASLVIGKRHDGGGRFIKTQSGGVYVVKSSVYNFETKPSAWLKKEFFRVENAETIAVTHEKPEDSFTLVRESQGAPLGFKDPAEGEEINTGKLAGLSSVFGSASFNDYVVGDAAKVEATGLDKGITTDIKTFDGFHYVVKLGKKNSAGEHHLSFQVEAELPPLPELPAAAGDDLSEEEKAQKAEERTQIETERTRIEGLAEKLEKEKKFAGKVYLVSDLVAKPVYNKRSDLVMTEEDRKKAAEDAAKAAAGAGAGAGANPGLPIGPGGTNPNIISTGPNGEKRVTATTPPVSVDPEILAAEREKQEKAVRDQAAIQRMIQELREEKGGEGEGEGEGGEETEEGSEAAGTEAPAGEDE